MSDAAASTARARLRYPAVLRTLPSRLQGILALQAGQGFVWFPVWLGIGITWFFALPSDPPAAAGNSAAVLFGSAFAIAWIKRSPFVLMILPILGVSLGFWAAELRTSRVDAPMLEKELGPAWLSGKVQWVDERNGRARATLSDLTIEDLAPDKTPAKVRITLTSRSLRPNIGDQVNIRAVLLPPSRAVVPDGFDFRRQAYFQRVGATGYAVSRWDGSSEARSVGMIEKISALRRAAGDRIRAVLPGPEGAVAGALLTGERAAVPEALQEAYRTAGLAHLLAISGLHMSLLAAAVFMLVRRGVALNQRLAESLDTKKLAASVAFMATAAYLLLSGANIPAQRAFMMVGIALLAILLDRNPVSLRLVALAAALILLVQPEALLGVSFQMSFAAVICLVAAYEALRRHGWLTTEKTRTWAGVVVFYLLGVVITDFVAGSATAPFAAYHFNRLPAYSLVANVLAVPVMGLWVMPAALLSLATMPFGLEALPLLVMGQGIAVMDTIAQMVAGWPGAAVAVPAAPVWAMAALTVGFLILCLVRGPVRLVGVLPIVVACAAPWITGKPFVLADEDAKLIAVRVDDGLVMPPGGSGFVRDTWTRRYGVSATRWDELATCDGRGCVIEADGRRVAWSMDPAALEEDCQAADIVVSQVPIWRECEAPVAIGRFDLWRYGAHAVFTDGQDYRIERVSEGDRPDRPWTLPR